MTQASGTLFGASPPTIRPRLIDGRSNSSDDSRENGIDSIRRKTSTAFTIALSPSHGVEPCAARPWTRIRRRQHALGLDADVQVGRLAGDREVADVAAPDEVVARAALDVLGLLVGHDHEPHAHVGLVGEVVQRRTSSPRARPSCRRRRGRTAGRPRCAARTAPDAPGRRRGGRGRRASGRLRARPMAVSAWRSPKWCASTSMSRASSQPLTNPAAACSPSAVDVS